MDQTTNLTKSTMTSLLGSINMRFLHFAREALYWMLVLKSVHLELVN